MTEASDRTLINPTPEEFDEALGKLSREGGLDDTLMFPEGHWTWGGGWDPRSDSARSVRLAWWTDCLGRRHYRMVQRTCQRGQNMHRVKPLNTWPILQVYPEFGFEVSRGEDFDARLFVCPCGAFGSPEELAWMGTECGLCHDQRTEHGHLPARPWDRPFHDLYSNNGVRNLLWDTVHPGLLLLGDDGRLPLRCKIADDWTVTPDQELPDGKFAWSPDRNWILFGDGFSPVHVAPLRSEEAAVPLDLIADRFHFSPSGRWFFAMDGLHRPRSLHLWDWESRTPVPGSPLAASDSKIHWALSADECRLAVATSPESIEIYHMETGERTVFPVAPREEREPLTSLHWTPDDRQLILHSRTTFDRVDATTGELTLRRRIAAFEPAEPARFSSEMTETVLLSPDRRTLVGFDSTSRRMRLVSLPDLDRARTLAWYGPTGKMVTENGHWLAVGDGECIRLMPWGPLLEWYDRER